MKLTVSVQAGCTPLDRSIRWTVRVSPCINLGMIAALNRPHELKLHIKGALNNGLSKDQIRDVFLQVTVYCGAPAGIDSMRLAREAFKEIEAEK